MKHRIGNPIAMSRAIAVGIFLTLATVVVTGCDALAEPEPREHRIEITNFVFVPAVVNARVGDTITWVNSDIVPHTATGEGGSWDTGSISKGESKSLVVTAGMVSDYICRFHPTMKGALRVTPE